jgi:hypothetical protein
MASLPPVDPESSPALEAAFKHIEASRGYVSNLMRCLMHSPEATQAHGTYGHYMRFCTDLKERQRELVICATVRGVPYAWKHHGQLLMQLGLSAAQMSELESGTVPQGLEPDEQAIVAYTFAFAACRGLSDEVLAETRRYFSYKQIVDASLLSAYFMGGGALITAFAPELDPADAMKAERDWQTKRPHR